MPVPGRRRDDSTAPPRRRSRAGQILRLGLAGAVLLATATAAVFAWLLLASLPSGDRALVVKGIDGAVEILRDRHGVPHIFAESLDDATFALGFMHAEDRLWQMDMRRRAARGRLAEILGPGALPSDRKVRTLGLAALVEAEYAALSLDAKRAVDAYADGVNAWLAANSSPLPPEFLYLGYRPGPWQTSDSLLWTKLMALRLAGNQSEEWLREALLARLSPGRLRELWPDHDGTVTTLARRAPAMDLAAFRQGAATAGLVATEERGASNGWVVAGARTESGAPLLANDPHLGLKTPATWYLVHIETPEQGLIGASTPGFPFIVIGQNRAVAWGITNTGSDLEDLFVERVIADDPSRYQTPDGSRPFAVRREMIRVKGASAAEIVVRTTRHGPVVSDLLAPYAGPDNVARQTVLALAATYLQPGDRTMEAAWAINRARNWRQFVAALVDFHAPQINVLWASRDGSIGFIAPGRVPIRDGVSGWMPRPGWTGDADWRGWIPFADLPQSVNPARGYIANANNRLTGADYPYDLGAEWQAGFRADRLERLLADRALIHLDGMRRIQMDPVSAMVRRVLPLLLAETPPTPETEPVLAALAAWDGTMAVSRPEPLIAIAWIKTINEALVADELGPEFPRYHGLRPLVLIETLTTNPHWCDDIDTDAVETCPRRLALALRTALARLEDSHAGGWTEWRWGDAHAARFAHPFLARFDRAARWLAPLRETAGGEFTINRGGMRLTDPEAPFAHVHGATLRAVFDLGDPSRSTFVIAGGQSGHPFSRLAANMLNAWREGTGIELLRGRDAVAADSLSRIGLRPAPPADTGPP